jgi:hypothetical protein
MPDPTADLLTALQDAHFALVEAADHIRRREAWSPAYRRASNASDAAREALIKHRRANNA